LFKEIAMRIYILLLGIASTVAIAALLLFAVTLGSAAQIQDPAATTLDAATTSLSAEDAASSSSPVIIARRAISIPYGIDATLMLGDDGRAVAVTGHGDCLGGETFGLMVFVWQQNKPTIVGLAAVEGTCTGGTQQWSADAFAQGDGFFVEGDARACGIAQVRDVDNRTTAVHWCKDVRLIR
jgi:hypothetical protein